MAVITFRKTIESSGGGGPTLAFNFRAELTLSVDGDNVTYYLTVDRLDSYANPAAGWGRLSYYGLLPYRSETLEYLNWEDGQTISGSFTSQYENGTVQMDIRPPVGYQYVGDENPPVVSESFTGAIGNYAPTAAVTIPSSVAAGSTIAVKCTMSDANGDALTGVLKRYYRAASAGSYTATTINNNLTRSTTVYDTIPANYGGGKVYYELTVSDGKESVQATSATKTITSNTAPTTPPSLTIPSSIAGNSTITISWEASTDADGNLAGYILERSTDSGANWTQVYQGDALTTTDFIQTGTNNVRYRVKAYDTYNAESGWRIAPSSGDQTVTNNQAPSTPASPITITPSALTTGVSAVISWGESTDPDGDNFEYELYRKADSGSYTKIYTGTARTYTDTVGSWSTVTYRVRAVDVHGAASSYLTANARSVSSNTVPTLAVTHGGNAIADGDDLGAKSAAFTLSYTPNDADASDTLTVKEYVDGVLKKTVTGATHNTALTFNFQTGANASTSYWNTLLNGSHTITISVSDGSATVSQTFTFLKSVNACLITLKNPIAAKTGTNIDVAAVSISGKIPAGGITAVQVTANGGTTWEDCIIASTETGYAESGIGDRIKTSSDTTTKRIENAELLGGHYLFIKKLATAGASFNFRVQAQAVTDGDDVFHGWISSVQGTFTEVSAT